MTNTKSIRRIAAIGTGATIKWIAPRVVEVSVGLEINAYARAELN